MSQIFRHSSNTFARTILFGAVFILGLAGWAVDRVSRSDYATRASQVRQQPVPFSHEHHVGDLGVDCRYCHTTVETSSFANIDRKSTRLNSSHRCISYAVFCLKNHHRAEPASPELHHEKWRHRIRCVRGCHFFFFKEPATTDIYPLPLHHAFPI